MSGGKTTLQFPSLLWSINTVALINAQLSTFMAVQELCKTVDEQYEQDNNHYHSNWLT